MAVVIVAVMVCGHHGIDPHPPPHLTWIAGRHYSLKSNTLQTVHPMQSMFGSRLGFSGSMDQMAIRSVRSNSNKGEVGENLVCSSLMHQPSMHCICSL